jgi:hypothetical protein
MPRVKHGRRKTCASKTLTQGWKRMKNLDLWARLDAAAKPHRIAWK